MEEKELLVIFLARIALRSLSYLMRCTLPLLLFCALSVLVPLQLFFRYLFVFWASPRLPLFSPSRCIFDDESRDKRGALVIINPPPPQSSACMYRPQVLRVQLFFSPMMWIMTWSYLA